MDPNVTPGEHMAAERIAAYLDGGLRHEEREDLERHLLICSDCRQDLAEASELTPQGRSRWLTRAAPLAATAAAAAALLLWIGAPDMSQGPAGEPTLRGPGTPAPLQIVAPLEGSTTNPESLVFLWRAAAGVAYYVFTLTDANGDVVFTVGQPDTTLVLPRSVGLNPGAQYFWVVDALLDGAQSTSTEFHGIVVE